MDEESASGIYEIRNSETGCVYVGSSRNVVKRLAGHKGSLERGHHPNEALQDDWLLHGADAFTFTVVQRTEPTNKAMHLAEKACLRAAREAGAVYNVAEVCRWDESDESAECEIPLIMLLGAVEWLVQLAYWPLFEAATIWQRRGAMVVKLNALAECIRWQEARWFGQDSPKVSPQVHLSSVTADDEALERFAASLASRVGRLEAAQPFTLDEEA